MELTTTFTSKSLRETSALTRKWHFWPVQILGNVRAALYLCVGLFVGGKQIFEGVEATPMNAHMIEKGLMVFFFLAVILFFIYYKQAEKMKKANGAAAPTRLSLEGGGLSMVDTVTGVTSFEPWSVYWFKMGKHTVALTRADGKGYRAIPTDMLGPMETEQLRGTLLAHLPETAR